MKWKSLPDWLSVFSGGAVAAIATTAFFACWYLGDLFQGTGGYTMLVIGGLVVLATVLFLVDVVLKVLIKKRIVLNIVELALVAVCVFLVLAS